MASQPPDDGRLRPEVLQVLSQCLLQFGQIREDPIGQLARRCPKIRSVGFSSGESGGSASGIKPSGQRSLVDGWTSEPSQTSPTRSPRHLLAKGVQKP